MNNSQGSEWSNPCPTASRWAGVRHSGALRAQRGALRTHRVASRRVEDAGNHAEGVGATLRAQGRLRGHRRCQGEWDNLLGGSYTLVFSV